MDYTNIITIAIVVGLIYLAVKFIVSPALKLISGILIFIIILALLKNLFNIDLNQFLGPYSEYIDLNKWISSFDWLINMSSSYIKNLKPQ